MKALLGRFLRYEFKFSVRFLLSVTVVALVVNAIWPHASAWWFVPIGVGLGQAEIILQRWERRKPPQPDDGGFLSS